MAYRMNSGMGTAPDGCTCPSVAGLRTCVDGMACGGSCGRGLNNYVAGQGHEHLGPGTSLTEFVAPNYHVGMGCACNRGMGLFESGIDFTSWTWKEWFAVGIGGYVITSMLFTGRRAARQVSEGVTKRVRRSRRALGSRIAGREL